jgi:hypothetical protein
VQTEEKVVLRKTIIPYSTVNTLYFFLLHRDSLKGKNPIELRTSRDNLNQQAFLLLLETAPSIPNQIPSLKS